MRTSNSTPLASDAGIRRSVADLPADGELLDRLGDLITALDPKVAPAVTS
ncbi:hypothetical protein FHR83_007806 [Actinoplanes campanulatus]|uniref:Uncharacterized protein n=1 Tax=Actinoplanes campanulatus TaxID=113559 RepID=A0A7W5FIT8_9ACTN|nr:hypothetical protein [Actinoplanes campanulatus]MBB3100088.1 hypothetical protein [Actinoplanes campanulatus]GID38957.1 hypothetical protein Aca09nite_54630 [Actinoplanes campanulatus]